MGRTTAISRKKCVFDYFCLLSLSLSLSPPLLIGPCLRNKREHGYLGVFSFINNLHELIKGLDWTGRVSDRRILFSIIITRSLSYSVSFFAVTNTLHNANNS